MRTLDVTAMLGVAFTALTSACDTNGARPAATASIAPVASGSHAAPSASAAPTSAGIVGAQAKLEHDTLVTPPGVPTDGARPLVVFLHGLGATGAGLTRSLEVAPLAERLGFSFIAPDGALDQHGRRFWNAGHACCDFDARRPDHVRMIGALAPDLEKAGVGRFENEVVVGFSNGAFMAHRLACDVPRIRAIVAISGSIPGPGDPPCAPTHPVRVIVVHGDADTVVPYGGGPVLGDTSRVVASARQTAQSWADHNGCRGGLGPPTRRDLVSGLEGDETRTEAYAGCPAPVELWTVEGADHLGVLSPQLVAAALERALGS